jgi:hypothetical protein
MTRTTRSDQSTFGLESIDCVNNRYEANALEAIDGCCGRRVNEYFGSCTSEARGKEYYSHFVIAGLLLVDDFLPGNRNEPPVGTPV